MNLFKIMINEYKFYKRLLSKCIKKRNILATGCVYSALPDSRFTRMNNGGEGDGIRGGIR